MAPGLLLYILSAWAKNRYMPALRYRKPVFFRIGRTAIPAFTLWLCAPLAGGENGPAGACHYGVGTGRIRGGSLSQPHEQPLLVPEPGRRNGDGLALLRHHHLGDGGA
ncbi:unnamed protein product [Adineta ricciae]|uniref:Uncharacterized protein n=1 Tax=Adineta ricciae TaxID=249248 RepID=A0A814IHV2_ADIRI|nr:unnamed protein product [Adineta ricciae]CAF1493358.1 unnamed protein product [Adineta ricciae]